MNTRSLGSVPFDKLARLVASLDSSNSSNSSNLGSVFEQLALKSYAGWILPQLTAFLAPVGLKLHRQANGLYSGQDYLLALKQFYLDSGKIANAEYLRGIIIYCMADPRGLIIPTQTNSARYAATVPLILAALKQNRNIPYSAWDWTTTHNIVDPKLQEFVEVCGFTTQSNIDGSGNNLGSANDNLSNLGSANDNLLNLSNLGSDGVKTVIGHKIAEIFDGDLSNLHETLLSFRNEAAIVRTGPKAGSIRNPKAMTMIYKNGIDHPKFNALPNLVKVVMLQTWIAHPSIRSDYGFNSVFDLDTAAAPLIDININYSAPPEAKLEKSSTKLNLPF